MLAFASSVATPPDPTNQVVLAAAGTVGNTCIQGDMAGMHMALSLMALKIALVAVGSLPTLGT
ncbi:hypothetical protein D3C76_1078550 [compost metagenome]